MERILYIRSTNSSNYSINLVWQRHKITRMSSNASNSRPQSSRSTTSVNRRKFRFRRKFRSLFLVGGAILVFLGITRSVRVQHQMVSSMVSSMGQLPLEAAHAPSSVVEIKINDTPAVDAPAVVVEIKTNVDVSEALAAFNITPPYYKYLRCSKNLRQYMTWAHAMVTTRTASAIFHPYSRCKIASDNKSLTASRCRKKSK
jgi:hypothetical protein